MDRERKRTKRNLNLFAWKYFNWRWIWNNDGKVGKDVKELKEYEETLVRQYKLYIDYLNDSIKEVNKLLAGMQDKSDAAHIQMYGEVCIKCLGNLLERLSHFNFTSDIIEIIVQQLTNKNIQVNIARNQMWTNCFFFVYWTFVCLKVVGIGGGFCEKAFQRRQDPAAFTWRNLIAFC